MVCCMLSECMLVQHPPVSRTSPPHLPNASPRTAKPIPVLVGNSMLENIAYAQGSNRRLALQVTAVMVAYSERNHRDASQSPARSLSGVPYPLETCEPRHRRNCWKVLVGIAKKITTVTKVTELEARGTPTW
jgi:hypothetical protein